MNPKLGDVGFKAGGKSYVLNMGVNALCLVEEATKSSASDTLERVLSSISGGALRVLDLRTLFWAGLQRHHPDIDPEAAGDLMQSMRKGKSAPLDVILDSMKRCSPDPEPAIAEAGEAAGDPPQPETGDGTGTPSS